MTRTRLRHAFGVLAAVILLACALAAAGSTGAAPLSSSVVVSQVYGGGGNSGATYTNDFIELYNPTGASVDLTGWSVQYASTTGTSWSLTSLAGSIGAGAYYLIQEAQGAGGTTPLPTPNTIGTTAMSAAAGKVALLNTNTTITSGTSCPSLNVVDLVGYGSTTNCFEGIGPAPTLSNTTAALRAGDGATDTDSNSADFASGAPNPRTSAGVSLSVSDVTANEGNAGTTAFDFIVSLSSAAGPGGVTFDIATADDTATSPSDYTAKALTGQTIPAGSSTYTFTVLVNGDTDDEPSETFFVNVTNVVGATVADGQGKGTILNDDSNPCAQPYRHAYEIQGSGSSAAITGSVATEGVVVGDYEGPSPTLRGFYLEDSAGDGNPATSDGIFVFNGNNDSVDLGDVVHVTGTAAEFQDQTQVTASTVAVCSTGNTLSPVDVTLPVPDAGYLERYEGMLVRLPQTLYVTEHFQLGRFGQVLLSSGGRLQQPTNVVAPGAPAAALQAQNDLNKLIADDALQNQNPDPILFGRGGNPLSASNTLRGGDTVTGLVGVMTYTWAGNAASGNAFRVRPIGALGGGGPDFQAANARPVAAPPVGGNVHVAAMNLLNYFNTFGTTACNGGVGGAVMECRGADSAAEFDRQWPKTVAAITGLDPDVLAIMEMENDGYGPSSAIQDLVTKLNDATAPGTYSFVDADAQTGQLNALGTDAIKVGMIYKPARATPVGQTAALNSVAFVNGGDSAERNRPSLAQPFQLPNGERFIVDANHLKSKGSACDAPDAGDGQANCNVVRVNAANQLTAWLAGDPTGTGDPDVLIVGDLNSYAMEDPITAIESAGYTNLLASLVGPDAYSFLFDGQFGYLDHALGSLSLTSQVSGIAEWHINADEPSVLDYNTDFKTPNLVTSLYAPDKFRMSDHDPLIVGLTLNTAPTATFNAPSPAFAGLPFTLSLTSPNDPNTGDTLTYAFDCGNGYGAFGPISSVSCDAPTDADTLSVGGKIRDNEGATTEYRATVDVTVTFESLCALTRVYSSSAKVADQLCKILDKRQMSKFTKEVQKEAGKAFTQEEAATLVRLAGEL